MNHPFITLTLEQFILLGIIAAMLVTALVWLAIAYVSAERQLRHLLDRQQKVRRLTRRWEP